MIRSKKLEKWVKEWADLCQPDAIHWCDGSEEENRNLMDLMVKTGMAVKLDRIQTPKQLLFSERPK